MKILSQSEQWPDRCAGNRHPMHPEETPDPSDLAAEDFDRQRRQRYPRGEGPPLSGEDDPHDLDPEGASLDDHDPERYLADPFPEEEVDDWPDPDIGHAPGPHPYGTPTYTPGGGIPHEDYDPNSLDNLPPDEPGGEDIHHFAAFDPWAGRCNNCSHKKERHDTNGVCQHVSPGVKGKVAPYPCGCTHYEEHSMAKKQAVNAVNALDPEHYEYLVNRDPAQGMTYPQMHGGDPEGAVSVRPHDEAGSQDAQVLRKEQTGLEYDVIARPSPDGKGWDVLRPLG